MHTADSPTFWSGLAIVVLASVACGLIAALAFVVLAFTSPKIHQSTAVIEISPPFQFQSLQSTNSPKSVAPDLETQARIVVSRDFATRVVRYLNLETREDFLKGLNSTSRDTVELLKSCVSATPIRNSNLISITAQHPNPNMAADIANAFSQYYVRYTAEKEGAIQFAAVKWLKDQVEEQRKKTEGSRTALDSARATLATVS
ncbi:MAG: hypothetical protein SFY92_09790, partial [Verrucomicrobiae bacterium]|nr:hypothetical protein [Verrucomicrobiae bacterium]